MIISGQFHFLALLTQQQEMIKKTKPIAKRARLAASRPMTAGRQVQSGFQTYPLWHSVQKSQSTLHEQHPVLHSILQTSFSLLQATPPVEQQGNGIPTNPVTVVEQPTSCLMTVPLLALEQVVYEIGHLQHKVAPLPGSQNPLGQLRAAKLVWSKKNVKKITAKVFIFILYQD